MADPTYQERVEAAKSPPDLKAKVEPAPRPLLDVAEEPTGRIRPETAEALKGMASAMAEQREAQPEEGTEPEEGGEAEAPLDLASLWSSMDPLHNPKRKKAIEERLKPLKLEDLLMKREIRQRVPIIPDTLEVTFRTIETHEDLYLKRLLFSDDQATGRYGVDRMSVLTVAAGLVALNDQVLPDHVEEAQDGTRSINKKLFAKKVQQLDRFPVQLLSDLSVNYQWFDERVRALFTEGNLKNG